MKVDLSAFIESDDKTLSINGTLDSNESNYDLTGIELVYPIKYEGNLYDLNEELLLDLNIEFKYNTCCSRCLEPITDRVNSNLKVFLLENLEDVEDDDPFYEYYQMEGDHIFIDDLIYSQIITSIPIKTLCKSDCKGLCPECGQNLNLEECKCQEKSSVDPRLEILKDLIDEEV